MKEFVSRTMYRILSNDLALLYNLNGRNGKEEFKSLSIFSLLYRKSFVVIFLLLPSNFSLLE